MSKITESGRGTKYRGSSASRGYDRKWRVSRGIFLKKNPLCAIHLKRGEYVGADVVDHIIPHKGDMNLFWNIRNWQSLCKNCHDSVKQKIEKGTYKEFGEDGYAITHKNEIDI